MRIRPHILCALVLVRAVVIVASASVGAGLNIRTASPGLIFLIARSCQSEFGCAADEKLFTVAADFNRLRDPCDPFLLCASNPLGGRALWLAASVASTYGGQRRAAPCPTSKMHGLSATKSARLSPRPHSLVVTFRR